VQASLVRVNRSNGARAVVASVSSNISDGTGTRKQTAAFNSPLNFEAFYYYVRIDMDRSAANQVVRAIGIALERTPS
jgi:hypothetical protein